MLRPTASSRSFTAFLIYVAVLLDNVLLTVIVPILPDYLAELHASPDRTALAAQAVVARLVPQSLLEASIDRHYVPMVAVTGDDDGSLVPRRRLADENGAIGVLLAAKALVQLLVTPFVGGLAQRVGYRWPIVAGTGCLLVASLVFALGTSYAVLLVARALQGVASACIGVCGMSLVAQLYEEVERRSRIMGIILGSVALGVLVGYPFGGIMYDWAGNKAAPFWVLGALVAGCLVLQVCTMDFNGDIDAESREMSTEPSPSSTDGPVSSEYSRCLDLLANRTVRLVIGAIWLSTSAMAILEPCLPIWLMENLHPQRWQVGTVFVPDSVGYFVGTNFFAAPALRCGQLRVAVGCLLMVGVSCFVIPNAASVLGLLLPHFTLGLGIGVLDAALVPLLATLVDHDFVSRCGETSANYGIVYAVQQMAVSLAYAMGPLLGGLVAQYVSFGWLMAAVGCANCGYALVLLAALVRRPNAGVGGEDGGGRGETSGMLEFNDVLSKDYRRFYDSMETAGE